MYKPNKLNIPNSVTSIGTSVFSGCTNLKIITIADTYAGNYYNTYKGLLRKAIKIKNGKIYIVKGEDDELLKTICVYALKLNEDIFPFYLKKFSSCLI